MNSLLKQLCRFHIPSVLCAAGILIVCVIKIPVQDTSIDIPNFDKIVHFTMFFTLSLLFIAENRMLSDRKWKEPIPLFLLAVLLTAFFGGMIEFIQGEFTNYRSADIFDWYSDMAGSFSAVAISGIVIIARELVKKNIRK